MRKIQYLPLVIFISFLFTVYLIPEDMFFIKGYTIKRTLLIVMSLFNIKLFISRYIKNGVTLSIQKNSMNYLLLGFIVYLVLVNFVGSYSISSTFGGIWKFFYLTINVYFFVIYFCKKWMYFILNILITLSVTLSLIIFTEHLILDSFYVRFLGYELTESCLLKWWWLRQNHTSVLGLWMLIPTGPFSSAHDIGVMQSFPLCYAAIILFAKKSFKWLLIYIVIFLSLIFSFKFTNMVIAVSITLTSYVIYRKSISKSLIDIPLISGLILLGILFVLSPLYTILSEIFIPGTEIYIKGFGRTKLFNRALHFFIYDMDLLDKLTGIGFGVNQAARSIWLEITSSLGDIGLYWEKLIELGIIGFVILMMFYFTIIINVSKIKRKWELNKIDNLILTSIIVFLMINLITFSISFRSTFWYQIAIPISFFSVIKRKHIEQLKVGSL